MKKKIVFSLGFLCLIFVLQGVVLIWAQARSRRVEQQLVHTQDVVQQVTEMKAHHYAWLNTLSITVYSGAEFTGSLDPTVCELGQWLQSDEVYKQSNESFQETIAQLGEVHNEIHHVATEVVELRMNRENYASDAMYRSQVLPAFRHTIEALDSIKDFYLLEYDGLMEQNKNNEKMLTVTVCTLTGLSLACGILLIVINIKRILPPLRKLTKAAEKISIGQLNVDAKIQSNDEFGELSKAFQKMIRSIAEQAAIVSKVADGDLTVDIEARSEKDILNQKLKQMVERNHDTLSDIRRATHDVKEGANSIATSSQNLAGGSIEQANTIEQLNISVAHVNQLSNKIVTDTDNLHKSTDKMLSVAEKGTDHMQKMLAAVAEINRASTDIGGIIKVIEDIAFQTNILALNAAVEAARAGVHGKGFAVVADEVRMLAAKSAQAANETTSLIANSVQKAADGVEIAHSTEAALARIIEEVHRAVSTIEEIDVDMENLHRSFEEINNGISSVSVVVQQNSSASQQAATASQSLSALAKELNQLVRTYKIAPPPWIVEQQDEARQDQLDDFSSTLTSENGFAFV